MPAVHIYFYPLAIVSAPTTSFDDDAKANLSTKVSAFLQLTKHKTTSVSLPDKVLFTINTKPDK